MPAQECGIQTTVLMSVKFAPCKHTQSTELKATGDGVTMNVGGNGNNALCPVCNRVVRSFEIRAVTVNKLVWGKKL